MSVPASHCEAKLHGFRRTADGVVVSFVLHPAEVPQALALDPLGTRYMLALAQIGDDEQPVPRGGPEPERIGQAVTETVLADAKGRTVGSIPATGAIHHKDRRQWDSLPPQQQAGILCADKGFQKWAGEQAGWGWGDYDEEETAAWLRDWLGIESRKELAHRPELVRKLGEIRAEFLEWAGRVPVAPR